MAFHWIWAQLHLHWRVIFPNKRACVGILEIYIRNLYCVERILTKWRYHEFQKGWCHTADIRNMESNGELFKRTPFVREQRKRFLGRNAFALNVIHLLSHWVHQLRFHVVGCNCCKSVGDCRQSNLTTVTIDNGNASSNCCNSIGDCCRNTVA